MTSNIKRMAGMSLLVLALATGSALATADVGPTKHMTITGMVTSNLSQNYFIHDLKNMGNAINLNDPILSSHGPSIESYFGFEMDTAMEARIQVFYSTREADSRILGSCMYSFLLNKDASELHIIASGTDRSKGVKCLIDKKESTTVNIKKNSHYSPSLDVA